MLPVSACVPAQSCMFVRGQDFCREAMGVVDDYYGGYENLAMNTDSAGNVDFVGAYGSACGFNSDSDSNAAMS